MPDDADRSVPGRLPALLALLVAVATLGALLDPGSAGTVITLPTVRGDMARFLGSGLYRFDPVAVAREALVWDIINLFGGVSALLVAWRVARRGDRRGVLALAGLAAYFLYVYLMYATMSALNRLFPVYVGIAAVAAVLLATLLARIAASLPRFAAPATFPVRMPALYLGAIAIVLVLLWSARIAAVAGSGHFPAELAGIPTLVTQAFDLALVVPLCGGAALLLRRGHPWGVPLAGMALTFGVPLDLAIPAWIASAMVRDAAAPPLATAPFFAISLLGALMCARYLRALGR